MELRNGMAKPTDLGARQIVSAYMQTSKALLARKLSRHIWTILLLLVLGSEAGVGLFVIRDLARSYTTVEKMYNGSVQGLLRFGDLEFEAQETRRSTLYALTTNDGNLQVDYADQSRKADRGVTQDIIQYLAQAHTRRESELGQRLQSDWAAYLKVRDEVLGLILEGSPKEAVQLDLSVGVPEFERVRLDLEEIKETYSEQASQQLAAVAEFSRRSMTRLTASLLFGLLFGSVAIWAIQKSRMRSAVQLANLQMDFVASVSHELRTPITAILTAGENIRDGLVLGSESLFEHASVITDQAGRLSELVDQVLLFAATSTARPSHLLRELRVDEVVADAIRSTKGLLEKAGATMEVKIEPGLPPIVGDLSVLSQCLENLIANAVKYSAGNRWVGIAARLNQEAQEIEISVQDRGIGIPASDLAHIFEPFYRSPQAVAAHIPGTGLGLSIAKRSAEALGGRLSVSTQIGVGSVFTVRLPFRNEALQGIRRHRVPELERQP
jgi:signal transduction histidine kinase